MQSAAAKLQGSSRLTQGYLICLIGTILWSSTAVFIRHISDAYRLPSLVLAFWRDAFVVLVLAAVFLLIKPLGLRLGRRHLPFIILYGFVLSIFNSLWTISVALNGAGISTVLVYSSAAFTAVLGRWLYAEGITLVKILAVCLSLVGCAFVSGAYDLSLWQTNSLGILTGALSGLAFAAYSLLGKAAAERAINPWTTLLYTFGFGALFLLSYNFIPGLQGDMGASPNLFALGSAYDGWGYLIALAIVPTIGGYGLYTVSLGYLPASVANLIATLEPTMTAALAYLLLAERFSGIQLFGSLLIIGGVVTLRLRDEGSRG